MPTIAIHPLPLTMTDAMQQPAPRLPLRRAVYVHVSDLTNAYNIDHAKLEHELAKVKERNSPDMQDEERDIDLIPPGGDGDSSVASVPQQQRRLQPPRAGFNLCVLVGKVKVVVDKLRVDRSRVLLAEVEVGDETGIVSLRARDEQIQILQEVSERSGAVVLRNCSVELFQGKHIRIAVTKWGKLSTYPDQVASTPPPPSKMNRDRNFSLIDLSLVASELVEMSSSDATFSPPLNRTMENTGIRPSTQQTATARQQQYQQMQQSRQNRKGPRDKRQQRPKPAGTNRPLAMHYLDSGMQGHMNPLPYSGMHGFSPSFGEGMDVSHYPYATPSEHRSTDSRGHSHQSSTQHLLMQQYEMHQRQLRQMQVFHEQQDRNRPMMQRHHQQGHQMQTSPMLVPNIGGSASFDTAGDYSLPSQMSGSGNPHQSMHLIGNNPMLMRVAMAGRHAPEPSMGLDPMQSPSTSGHQEEFRPYQVSQDPSAGAHGGGFVSPPRGPGSYGGSSESERPGTQAWDTTPDSNFTSKDVSPHSPSNMNVQASSFAPSYVKDPRGEQQPQQQAVQSSAYGYMPYDPSIAGSMYSPPSSQHPMYSQNVMYFPVATGGTQSDYAPEAREVSTSPSDTDPSKSREDSQVDRNTNPQQASKDGHNTI